MCGIYNDIFNVYLKSRVLNNALPGVFILPPYSPGVPPKGALAFGPFVGIAYGVSSNSAFQWQAYQMQPASNCVVVPCADAAQQGAMSFMDVGATQETSQKNIYIYIYICIK